MISYLKTWAGLHLYGALNETTDQQRGTWIVLVAHHQQPANLPDPVSWHDKDSRRAFWDWLMRGLDEQAYLDTCRKLQ